MWILIYVTASCLALSVAYVVLNVQKSRRAKQHAAMISREIILYFRKTGVEVAAVCTNLQGDERFTALIESEPMKRFRLSHIIEFTLRDHIHKTCGLELECIYWRFPVKGATDHVFPSKIDDKPVTIMPMGPGGPDTKAIVSTDEYINEGLVPYKDVPKIEVTELSWEKFEEAATLEVEKKTDTIKPPASE